MADGPSPAKKLKTDSSLSLPECPYGAKCYRKNPQHFKEYSHSSGSSSDDVDSKKDSAASKPVAIDDSHLPPCKYGANCYRKNLLHFAEFSHPIDKTHKKGSGSGSDTEVYDSDDDKDSKDVKKTDILSKGLSLVKKFSQMTDDERKELIKKAFEEKLRLQKELEGAKKLVEEKDKEVQSLQKQLNNGMLMMEGEEEALKKTETTYFTLYPERAYKEGSASQIHFRLAESQFYRLVSPGHQTRVTKVEYVVSPKVVKSFRMYQEMLRTKRGEEMSHAVLGFHGTDEKNIQPICEKGFKVPGDAGFHHQTDTGFYGAGVYFSEYPSYSMGYIRGGTKLMLCQVLPGRVYKCKCLIQGAKLQIGYDSHMSPCKNELIIFHSAAILPCYIIYFENNATATFTYKPSAFKFSTTTDLDYQEAVKAPVTKVFKGRTIALLGKMKATHTKIYELLKKHGAKQGSKKQFNLLIAAEDKIAAGTSAEMLKATEDMIPVVPETYIYQCIMEKKKLSTSDFENT